METILKLLRECVVEATAECTVHTGFHHIHYVNANLLLAAIDRRLAKSIDQDKTQVK